VPTFDAIDSSRLGDMAAAEIELALGGLLDADDLAKVKSITAKYVGAARATTNALGAVRAGDARDAGRVAAANVRAQCEEIQSINSRNRAFWDQNARDNALSIRR
jgi:hypothetical protein